MPITFLLLGGGGCWAFLEEGRGWKCQFCFYGLGEFSEFRSLPKKINEIQF